jgi:hypothetical protein
MAESPSDSRSTPSEPEPSRSSEAPICPLLIHDEPGGRYRTGAYAAWRLHVASLLEELGADGREAAGLADTLLAPAAADLVRHRRRELNVPRRQIKRELELLARGLVAELGGAG